MKWYELLPGNEGGCKGTAYYSADNLDFNHLTLKMGIAREAWPDTYWLGIESTEVAGKNDDFVQNSMRLPIAAPRLIEQMTKRRIGVGDIQCLPVTLYDFAKRPTKGFCIVNVITRIIALDRPNCYLLDENPKEVDPDTNLPNVKGIWGIALRSEALKGHDIIRLREFFPPVLVSERFRDMFLECGFTGTTFQECKVDGVLSDSASRLAD